jgi:lipoprotein-releasing system ATP-binding protein
MDNVVELRNVNKVYRGTPDVQALFDITLTFPDHSFSSIVGESGSGKSTLLNLIGSLDRPTSGEVIVDGVRTASLSSDGLADVRNRTLGFIFQFHYLLPEFTAMENALMPYTIGHGNPDREVMAWADELFELVGISRVKNNRSTKMSGGQQQRTAIVRALINKPRVVLADEPTGNLDSENTANIYRRFREINERYGTTFIVVTHDRRIAEQTDRIVEIRDGRILLDISR